MTLNTAGAHQIRHASIDGGYVSQHSTRLYFRLNMSDRVDTLTVQWPSSIKQRFDNISAWQMVRVTKGQGIVTLPLLPKLAVQLNSH